MTDVVLPADRIPSEHLVNGGVYLIRSRNLLLGVWVEDKRGFIGLREKLGSIYPFMEYEWVGHGSMGTAYATELVAKMPEGIELVERMPGSICTEHDRPCEWSGPPAPAPWVHSDDRTELIRPDVAYVRPNVDLHRALEQFEKRYCPVSDWLPNDPR